MKESEYLLTRTLQALDTIIFQLRYVDEDFVCPVDLETVSRIVCGMSKKVYGLIDEKMEEENDNL